MDGQTLEKEFARSYARGEYGRIIFRCDELLQNPAADSLRPLLLFWKGLMYTVSGSKWQGQALTFFREGLVAAGSDGAIKTRIMAGLAKIYSDSGECEAFAKLLPAFQRTARKAGPAAYSWGMYIWQNYGTALHNAFRFSDAVKAFTKAASLAQRFANSEMEGRCYHDISWSELEQNHFAKAAIAMAHARDLFPDEIWGHKKHNVQAEYLLATGDPTGALQQVQQSLAHPRIDNWTRADAHFAWAKALFALGNLEEAKEKALQSLDYAMKSANCPVLTKANRILHELGWPGPTP